MAEKQYDSCKYCYYRGYENKGIIKVLKEERMSIGEVLDKLNELSNENEQLKKKNKRSYYTL